MKFQKIAKDGFVPQEHMSPAVKVFFEWHLLICDVIVITGSSFIFNEVSVTLLYNNISLPKKNSSKIICSTVA